MNSFIYMIKCGRNKYKIGCSKYPEKRLHDLQVANPYKLQLIYIASCKNIHKIEKLLHKTFAKYKIHGEWFRFSKKQVQKFKKICLKYNLKPIKNNFMLKNYSLVLDNAVFLQINHLRNHICSKDIIEKSIRIMKTRSNELKRHKRETNLLTLEDCNFVSSIKKYNRCFQTYVNKKVIDILDDLNKQYGHNKRYIVISGINRLWKQYNNKFNFAKLGE